MFTVPLIPPDLRHEETIIQAAHALCCLENTIISVFDQVSGRIQKNDAKLQNINLRIGRAQEKVKGLVGTKKSIKIFAPSRFPATQILREEIPSTFSMMGQQSSRESVCRNDELPSYEIKTRPEQHSTHSQNEKLVFFHVRVDDRQNNELARMRVATNQQQGHGKFTEDTTFLTSALRYNSDELVFDSTSSETDTWKQAKLYKKQRRQLKPSRSSNIDNVRLQLAPAPHSLSHRDKKAALHSLRYTPRLSDLPNTELPLDLPDLPGIADDIQFVAQEQMHDRIAPSLLIEDLPDLEELENQQKSQETKSTANHATSTLETANLPPLPPPPPPPMENPNNRVNSNPMVTHLPPPPPPPPPLAALPTTSTVSSSQSSDMRSDLMAAIRNAGGAERAKLKPAAPINAVPRIEEDGTDGNGNDNKPASSGSGLMEELHNKLMLRRKGISGSKDRDGKDDLQGGGGNPLLSHLSTLIPQTNKSNMQAEQDNDDDDWAD